MIRIASNIIYAHIAMFYTKLKSSTIYRTINHLAIDLTWYFIIFDSQTHINMHKDIHISVLIFSINPYQSAYLFLYQYHIVKYCRFVGIFFLSIQDPLWPPNIGYYLKEILKSSLKLHRIPLEIGLDLITLFGTSIFLVSCLIIIYLSNYFIFKFCPL